MSLWLNLTVFAAAAAAVWFAGTRLSHHAKAISERTGLGKAFVGLILLGGVTSLPEVATTISAGLSGNAPLAVNNILGGVAMQVAVLAIADAFIGRDALSSVVVEPVIMLQATLDILLLVIVAAGIVVGEIALGGVGGWSSGMLVLYVFSIWLVRNYQGRQTWFPDGERAASILRGMEEEEEDAAAAERSRDDSAAVERRASLRAAILKTAFLGAVILVAGFALARTGEAIADQTGLGSSFVGAVLVAIATSLPEVSTVLSAMRLREYGMAFSDIFGTNLFDLVLIFGVDLVYAGPPVLREVGTFSVVGALLGIVVTTIYLAGLIERRDRTILRMGYDSAAVLVIYAAGLGLLYTLR